MCWSPGNVFAGTAINCIGGMNCFAASTYYTDYVMGAFGTFSGTAINCVVDGGSCFGFSFTDPAVTGASVSSGKVINCTIKDLRCSASPGLRVTEMTDNGAGATMTTSLSGDNNDLVWSARLTGEYGNRIAVVYDATVPAGTVYLDTEPVGLAGGDNPAVTIVVGISGGEVANDIKASIAAIPLINNLVSVSNAGGNDGSGAVTAMSRTFLTGGVDSPVFENNTGGQVIPCIDDYDVSPIENGGSFSNVGASGAVIFNLPPALIGLHYRFYRVTPSAGCDIYINPQNTEQIVLIDGTTILDAGYYRGNESDAFGFEEYHCFITGYWSVIQSVGTWMNQT
jgi:hypothetical protein